ncbi:MAG: anthranilate synthase component I family protein [Actinobacteria bacterium]|nr:anthranilate synthase component I family protein [Actinomycetota bacterium]
MTQNAHIPTDLLTPLGAYLRLREGAAASFLLESVEQGRLGRHSFIGSGSQLVTFEEAEALDLPVVGYLAYDHIAKLEPTVPLPTDGPDLPESRFVVAETLIRFDHGSGTAEVLAGDQAAIAARLDAELVLQQHKPFSPRLSVRRSPDQATYEEGVERIRKYIRAGDAFQVVLSQRAERVTSASALELYRALRRVNPSPYLFLLELGELALIGSSPETLVKCEHGRASLNPIAGTTHPGDGDAERLLESDKDRAEHVMLVDLGRNDLSRACLPGSVRVARFLEPERFSHVTHLVSEVTGELREGVTPFELLRACFPAGTVSGAPKVRAMQIVSELERYRRGLYAGAVGYVLPGGTMDTCIAIRTIVLQDGVAQLQAGAGIVADSDPAAEHRECLSKLAALEAAIDLAETGP